MTTSPPSPPLRLERTLTYRLHQLHKLTDADSQSLYPEQTGLSMSDGRCLSTIGSFAPLSIQALAEKANLNKGQASRAAQCGPPGRWSGCVAHLDAGWTPGLPKRHGPDCATQSRHFWLPERPGASHPERAVRSFDRARTPPLKFTHATEPCTSQAPKPARRFTTPTKCLNPGWRQHTRFKIDPPW